MIQKTGEMPNHVQSVYFAALGSAMKESGVSTGLCGEGADGLFGSDWQSKIQAAANLKRKHGSAIPTAMLSWLASDWANNISKRPWN